MNKLGAFVLTPLGFVIGGAAGQVIGMALAEPSGDRPKAYYRYGNIRPITQRELEWEKNGGIVGAAIGATIVAIMAAPSEPPKQPGTLSGAQMPPMRFP